MRQSVYNFAELDSWVRAYAKNNGLRLFVLVGGPGLSKSTLVTKHVPDQSAYFKAGQLTPFQLFKELYVHRDHPVVLDDVEKSLKEKATVRLLMSVTESDEGPRKVGWFGSTSQLTFVTPSGRTVRIPQEFRTESRVCVICNDWDEISKNLGALEDRGYVIFFEPSAKEVHAYVGGWFTDTEVYEYIGAHLHLIERPSIRPYLHASEMRKHGLAWKAMLHETWQREAGSPDLLVVRAICHDPRWPTRDAQCKEFIRQTGKSRATFWRYLKEIGLT